MRCLNEWRDRIECKFNPYHDPKNGQFTFATADNTGNSAYESQDKPAGTVPLRRQAVHSVASAATGRERVLSDRPRLPVTADKIRTIMPNSRKRADVYADALDAGMVARDIVTLERQVAFLAQISVESGDLQNSSESLNYSVKKVTEVWPERFPYIASAQPYANNPAACRSGKCSQFCYAILENAQA